MYKHGCLCAPRVQHSCVVEFPGSQHGAVLCVPLGVAARVVFDELGLDISGGKGFKGGEPGVPGEGSHLLPALGGAHLLGKGSWRGWVLLGWVPGLAEGSLCSPWKLLSRAAVSGALSRFLLLPALHHKESIYFPGVAGLPPLTWTLFGAAQTVWQGWGRLGWLQS